MSYILLEFLKALLECGLQVQLSKLADDSKISIWTLFYIFLSLVIICMVLSIDSQSD